MKTSVAEENYLKAIYKLTKDGQKSVSTNTLAAELHTTAASVTDMLKRLSDKALVHYIPYKGVSLTDAGHRMAVFIIRKHRLWEVFLVEKLQFGWEEVHETAEQLEHIKSPLLIQKLDAFLGYPKFDPHGEPIPNEDGIITGRDTILLSELPEGMCSEVAGVLNDEREFLQYLDSMGIRLRTSVRKVQNMQFDGSVIIEAEANKHTLSAFVATHILVLPV